MSWDMGKIFKEMQDRAVNEAQLTMASSAGRLRKERKDPDSLREDIDKLSKIIEEIKGEIEDLKKK